MDLQTLQALESALSSSPQNNHLRKQVAKGYYNLRLFDQAKTHLYLLLKSETSNEIIKLLAECYLRLGNTSTGLVICEEVLSKELDEEVVSTYLQLLINDGQHKEAIEQYESFQQQLPDWSNELIEIQLQIPNYEDEDEEEEEDTDDVFFDTPDMDFSFVGGMDQLKKVIQLNFILPIISPDTFEAYGKKTGTSILLFGPPGCGKTLIAKALAGELDSNAIAVESIDILDKWMGHSEKNLHKKFELARNQTPCILFFDEIDALSRKREETKRSNISSQFLKELDGLKSNNEGLLIVGTTNSPWNMDPAFLRPGRFDRIYFVAPPNERERIEILQLSLANKPINQIDYTEIASKTNYYSGADLIKLIDLTIEDKLLASMNSNKIERINTKDILKNVSQVKPSTKEWLSKAKRYALMNQNTGIYDDLLNYLDSL